MSRVAQQMISVVQKTKQRYKRYEKPRQEISRLLKYILFFGNFFFLLLSLAVLSVGVYLCLGYLRALSDPLDLVLNPGLVLLWLGALLVAIFTAGTLGALRDNMCLLKTYSLGMFGSYILLVIGAFLLFILFYSQSTRGASISGLLTHALTNYHVNDNMREFLDYIQTELECCGVGVAGYKDWSLNSAYNCTDSNQLPEACAVPFSCCLGPSTTAGDLATVEQANKLRVQMRSLLCWQHAQKKLLPELQQLINPEGCVQPVQKAFEAHALTIGALVGVLVIPVCISVVMSNSLAKQIERQHFLLHRQDRREQRRRRRQRQRFRDPFTENHAPVGRQTLEQLDETGGSPKQKASTSAAGADPAQAQSQNKRSVGDAPKKSAAKNTTGAGKNPDHVDGRRKVRRRTKQSASRARSAPSYAKETVRLEQMESLSDDNLNLNPTDGDKRNSSTNKVSKRKRHSVAAPMAGRYSLDTEQLKVANRKPRRTSVDGEIKNCHPAMLGTKRSNSMLLEEDETLSRTINSQIQ